MVELKTRNGVSMPNIGLGTFPFQGQTMADMMVAAVSCGYRLFDTADDYRGESGIGLGLRQLKDKCVAREDIFIQTKISDNSACADEPLVGVYFNTNSSFMNRHSAAELVREKVATSLREIGTDYLDSLLIHYPYPDYFVEIWREMIKMREEGIVRHVGVSNFHERQIEKLITETGVVPDINEIYLSPIATKQSLVEYCRRLNILPMSYSPLMDLAANRLSLDVLETLSARYGKSIAQIILRWNIDRGCVPLPKTKNPRRLAENFAVFDFALSESEVGLVSSLNRDYQYCVESRICPGA